MLFCAGGGCICGCFLRCPIRRRPKTECFCAIFCASVPFLPTLPVQSVRGSGFFADGEPVLANRRVYPGQTVSFELPPEGEGVAPQPEIPVNVVYEDAFAVVLEKPPHLAVHPTLNYPYDTLANGYAAWAAQQGISPVFRPVNRIDKDTSGLVLAAKHAYAAPLLARNVEKLYYAVVEGELPLGPGVIDAPIGRQTESIIGRCVTPDASPAVPSIPY